MSMAIEREVLPVRPATCLEVFLVGRQVPEVVVERPVLHRQHDDGVDRALRRRVVEDAVARDLRAGKDRCA